MLHPFRPQNMVSTTDKRNTTSESGKPVCITASDLMMNKLQQVSVIDKAYISLQKSNLKLHILLLKSH